MCELLVRVIDKVNDNPYLDAKCTKRGDVITIQPDGWGWGRLELANPEWTILKAPGMTVSEASALLAQELDTDPQNPSMVLQRRALRLDLDTIDTVCLTAAQLHTKKIQKTALADPNVFA